MESAGCLVWPRLIRAATCSSAGGYASQQGVCFHFLSLSSASERIVATYLIGCSNNKYKATSLR